jgi:Queuine tRNA-ribosyltransferase
MEFTIAAQCSKARRAVLTINGKTLQTPAILQHTKMGCIPHLVDAQRDHGVMPLSVYFEHFIEMVIEDGHANRINTRAPESFEGDLKGMLQNDASTPLVASCVDPARLRSASAWPQGKKNALGLMGRGLAHREVTASKLVELANILKPDLMVINDPSPRLYAELNLLKAGEPIVTDAPGKSKLTKRRKRWLSILEDFQSVDYKLPFFVGLGAHSNIDDTRETSKQVEALIGKKAFGYTVTLPTLSNYKSRTADYKTWSKQWKYRLAASLEPVDPTKPKYLSGCTSLEKMIIAIQQGVDLFENSWVDELTMAGKAIQLSWTSPLSEKYSALADSAVELHSDFQWTLDLTHTVTEAVDPSGTTEGKVLEMARCGVWRKDLGTLSANCRCWTCKRPYTRAYIHHLLNVKDMLAYILLHHHNIHQLEAWINAVRDSIADGTFGEVAAKFLGNKEK